MMLLFSIKELFTIKFLPYSFYVAFGVLLSQLVQIMVYYKVGHRDLQTWYAAFHITENPQSIVLTIQICLIMFVTLFLALQIFFRHSQNIEASSFLKYGIIATIAICIVSNLIFSSIMRIPYEALFCFVALFAILLEKHFIGDIPSKPDLIKQNYKELWDLLKFLIPICIGLPIVMGGAGFISSFYKDDQSVIRQQLYRHIYMALYFELGGVFLIIYPIFKRLLIYKTKLM